MTWGKVRSGDAVPEPSPFRGGVCVLGGVGRTARCRGHSLAMICAFSESILRYRTSLVIGSAPPGVLDRRTFRSVHDSTSRAVRRSYGESYPKWIPSSATATSEGTEPGRAATRAARGPNKEARTIAAATIPTDAGNT